MCLYKKNPYMDNELPNVVRLEPRHRPWKLRREQSTGIHVFRNRFVVLERNKHLVGAIVDGTLIIQPGAVATNIIVRKGGTVQVNSRGLLDNAFFYKDAKLTVYQQGRAINIKTTGHIDARLHTCAEIQLVPGGPIRADWLNHNNQQEE